MSTDKFIGLSLRPGALMAVFILAATPAFGDTPSTTQGQSCDFGNSVVTVGDVATAAGLTKTEGGQSIIDAADVTVEPKTPVPAPGSLTIFGAGLIALHFLRRRSRVRTH